MLGHLFKWQGQKSFCLCCQQAVGFCKGGRLISRCGCCGIFNAPMGAQWCTGPIGAFLAGSRSATVITASITGASGFAKSSQLCDVRPSVGNPFSAISFSDCGWTFPAGFDPADHALMRPPERWFKIASSKIERAELSVHKTRIFMMLWLFTSPVSAYRQRATEL